jgi:hypothetical protein
MNRRFKVEIDMGTRGAKTGADIAALLHDIQEQLLAHRGQLRPVHSRTITDANGSSVGSWNIEED